MEHFVENKLTVAQLRENQSSNVYHLPIRVPRQVVQSTPRLVFAGLQTSNSNIPIDNVIVDSKWHPFKSVIAFATKESVYIYSTLNQAWYPKNANGLTHELQSEITCISWCPFAASTLAVGTANGVCLWRIFFDSNSSIIEPSLNGLIPLISNQTMAQPWMFPYFVANAQDVSCVEWSPDGSLLVVGHNSSPVVAIWDVALHKATILSRGALDTTALRFSSDGSYLLQTISGNGIHIWETRTWDMQKMATGSSCNSIQWIPNSKMFMFSLQGSNKIHLLQMKSEPPNLEVTNAPSLDLPTLTHPRVQSHMNLPIESLHLDPTGSRLAVVFENTHEVGLYQLRMRPLPDLSPMYDCFNDSGWIYGPSDSKRQPQPRFATKFQPGALLSVQWDKTTIGFIPLYIK